MSLAEFIAKYNGVHIDEDGYYGAQCWDVSARYAREVVGCPSFPTVTGGAAGLFTNTAPVILQYFDRVANNPNDADQIPPDGAVIVWGTTWSPPYGHTAVKTAGDRGQNMTVIEQNGNNPGGAACIKSRNYTGVIGWLVPKGNTMSKFTKEQEMTASQIATGSNPGKDYNYQFTVQEIDSGGVDRFLQFWLSQSQLPKLNTTINELVKVQGIKDGVIADQKKRIESLKAQTGDNTKWEILKALIRELVGVSSTSN